MMLPGKAAPVTGFLICLQADLARGMVDRSAGQFPVESGRNAEKFPDISAAVGTKIVAVTGEDLRCRSSAEKKKKVLSRPLYICVMTLGPPTVPPNWLSLNGGFAEGGRLNQLRAFSTVLRTNSKALP